MSRRQKSFLKQLIPIRLDAYLATEVLTPFLGGVVFFTFILLMFQMLRLATALIEHSVPLLILLKIVGYMIITFMPIVLPLAFLFSVLVAFGRLSSDSELVAMKAHGVSIFRLSLPVFGLSLIVAALSLSLNLFWAPQAKYESRATLIRLTNTTPIATIQKSSFTSGFFGLMIYAENIDAKTEMLQNVFLYDERDERAPRTIIAPAGQIVRVKTGSDLGASIALKLYNGEIHSNNTSTASYQKTTFREYQVYLSVSEGANNASSTILNLPYKDLVNLKKTNTDSGVKNQIMTEIYSRWFTAFIPVFFVLIGIGFGTSRGRAATSSAALITLLIIVPVYIMQTVGQNFGNTGRLSPLIAIMIPNLLLLTLGIFAYRKTIW